MTKEQLETLKNSKLADAQPITAATHRSFEQDIINEMYNANSRAAMLVNADEVAATLLTGDTIFIKRGAAGVFIPKDAFALTVGSLRQTLTKASHGFVVGNVLTVDGTGAIVKVSNTTTDKRLGVVTAVADVNTFTVNLAGYVSGLSGLTPGSTYYATNTGTLSTSVSDMPVLIAATAATGYMLSAGSAGGGGLAAANFVTGEVPGGTLNSINTDFTLANAPTAGTVKFYRNGSRQKVGVDYSITGSTITTTTAPESWELLLADYMKP